MNALIIVDPQNDFINGSLAVPGAEKAINNIIKFIEEHKKDLSYIAITVDWHPYDHCSFKEYGGKWESHCIQYSTGASIYQPLLKAIIESKIPYIIWEKGTHSNKEEYSIFEGDNSKEFYNELDDRTTIDPYEEIYGRIYIAGLAGDFCVYRTVEDLISKGIEDWLCIFLDGIVSVEGKNVKLKNLVEKCGISYL